MSNRERFLKIARGELRGEVFLPYNLNYAWFMAETLARWRTEGLPAAAEPLSFFGFERVGFTGGAPYSPLPEFPEETLAEDLNTRTVRDEVGVIKRVFKRDEQSKMPQWLEYPVKSRADWERFKERLDPRTPERYPADWEEAKATWRSRDYPLGLAPGSFFGHTLQRRVGTESLCLLFYDAPAFVHEMLEYLEGFFLELIAPFLDQGIEFDFASFGEDIAYKGRSFLSPRMFAEFIQPHYVALCRRLRARGIEVIFVDSDGYLDELIPLWLEVGINAFSPLEVAAGMDALSLKKRYGTDIILAGSIDKRALIRGREAIDGEVEKTRRLLTEGGYFPAVDHSVPPDVPFENFCYFVEALRSL